MGDVAREIAEDIDLDDVAERIDVGRVAENVDVEEIAEHIEVSDVAGYLDFSELAGELDHTAVALHVDYKALAAALDPLETLAATPTAPEAKVEEPKALTGRLLEAAVDKLLELANRHIEEDLAAVQAAKQDPISPDNGVEPTPDSELTYTRV